jgi:hypothetical protein
VSPAPGHVATSQERWKNQIITPECAAQHAHIPVPTVALCQPSHPTLLLGLLVFSLAHFSASSVAATMCKHSHTPYTHTFAECDYIKGSKVTTEA